MSWIHDKLVAARKEDGSLDLLEEVSEEQAELPQRLTHTTCLLPPSLPLISNASRGESPATLLWHFGGAQPTQASFHLKQEGRQATLRKGAPLAQSHA